MRYRSVRVTFAWTLVAAATLAAAPTASSGTRPDCPRLSARWYGDNRAHLQRVIDERDTCAGRRHRRQGGPLRGDDEIGALTVGATRADIEREPEA
ncbi:hypothetical protein [Streptomyces mirabilis]|uniref:hypothetical protein n=1 Tax=Streptomyces mirabilis TaxID=68239 RepID=UPI003D9ECE8D